MAREELTKLRDGMLRYNYVADQDETTAFEVYSLSEIAPPYKQRFQEEIQNQDWIVDYNRTLPRKPVQGRLRHLHLRRCDLG